jgi:hypothetical protein
MAINFFPFRGVATEPCPVCFEEIDAGQQSVSHGVPPHIFHRACIERAAANDARCPLCRAAIEQIFPAEPALAAALEYAFDVDPIRIAAVEGNIDAIRHFLDNGRTTETSRSRALASAALRANVNIIQVIHQAHPMSDEQKAAVLHEAVQRNHREVIDFIFGLGPLGNAAALAVVREATQSNNIDLVRYFLGIQPNISVENCGHGAMYAAQNGNLELLELYFQAADFQIPKQLASFAAGNAAWEGHLACLQFILENVHLDDQDKGWPFIRAAGNNRVDCMRALYFDGSIPQSSMEEALRAAQLSRHEQAIQFLERYMPPRPTAEQRALLEAESLRRLTARVEYIQRNGTGN